MKLTDSKFDNFMNALREMDVEAVMVITKSSHQFRSATAHEENGKTIFNLETISQGCDSWRDFLSKVNWKVKPTPIPCDLTLEQKMEWIKWHYK